MAMKQMKFRIFTRMCRVKVKGEWVMKRRWFWNLKARNSRIIAQSEAYNSWASANRSVWRVKTDSASSIIEDVS
jgi:uncharacterized protein YegP (UPF0339 family)